MKNQIMTLTNGRTLGDLAHALEGYLILREKMDTQVLQTASGGYVVQARSPKASASQWVGLDGT